MDEDDRRYFKQREIFLWRKTDKRSPEGEILIDNSESPAIKFEARE